MRKYLHRKKDFFKKEFKFRFKKFFWSVFFSLVTDFKFIVLQSMKNEVVASQEAIERCENEIKQLEIEKEDSAMNVT